MSTFDEAVTDLVVAASLASGDVEEAYACARLVMEEAGNAEGSEHVRALQRLAEAMLVADVGYVGILGITAGALVERGAASEVALEGVLERLPEVLAGALSFAEACRQAAEDV